MVPHVTQGQHNLGRGKGQYFYHVSEEMKERGLHESAENSGKDPGTDQPGDSGAEGAAMGVAGDLFETLKS